MRNPLSGGLRLPFFSRRKRVQSLKSNRIIEFISPLVTFLTCAFTVICLTNFWGTSLWAIFFSCIGAIIFTAIEIVCFRNLFQGGSFWWFIGGIFCALVSIGGSYQSFEAEASKQELQKTDYQMSQERIKTFQIELKVFRDQQKQFQGQAKILGKLNDRIKDKNAEIDQERKKIDGYIDQNVGSSDKMFKAMAATTGWDIDTTRRRGLLFLACVLEGCLILSTLHSAKSELEETPVSSIQKIKPPSPLPQQQQQRVQVMESVAEINQAEKDPKHFNVEVVSTEKQPDKKSYKPDIEDKKLINLLYLCFSNKHPVGTRFENCPNFTKIAGILGCSPQYVEETFTSRYQEYESDDDFLVIKDALIKRYIEENPQATEADLHDFFKYRRTGSSYELLMEEIQASLEKIPARKLTQPNGVMEGEG